MAMAERRLAPLESAADAIQEGDDLVDIGICMSMPVALYVLRWS